MREGKTSNNAGQQVAGRVKTLGHSSIVGSSARPVKGNFGMGRSCW